MRRPGRSCHRSRRCRRRPPTTCPNVVAVPKSGCVGRLEEQPRPVSACAARGVHVPTRRRPRRPARTTGGMPPRRLHEWVAGLLSRHIPPAGGSRQIARSGRERQSPSRNVRHWGTAAKPARRCGAPRRCCGATKERRPTVGVFSWVVPRHSVCVEVAQCPRALTFPLPPRLRTDCSTSAFLDHTSARRHHDADVPCAARRCPCGNGTWGTTPGWGFSYEEG